jgi:hypothetical protein
MTRGFAISWLIVGMSAFTLYSRETSWLRKNCSELPAPSVSNRTNFFAQNEITPTIHR